MSEGRTPGDEETDEIKRLMKHKTVREVSEDLAKDAQDIAPKPSQKKPPKKKSS